MDFVWKLYGYTYAVHVTVALVGVATLNLALPPPPPDWPVSQYERPRAVALASFACVDKTTKIITEFTRKDPFLHLKQAN